MHFSLTLYVLSFLTLLCVFYFSEEKFLKMMIKTIICLKSSWAALLSKTYHKKNPSLFFFRHYVYEIWNNTFLQHQHFLGSCGILINLVSLIATMVKVDKSQKVFSRRYYFHKNKQNYYLVDNVCTYSLFCCISIQPVTINQMQNTELICFNFCCCYNSKKEKTVSFLLFSNYNNGKHQNKEIWYFRHGFL